MLAVNAGEWLLARGKVFAKGAARSINEYLLGRDGPRLTPGQQRWRAAAGKAAAPVPRHRCSS